MQLAKLPHAFNGYVVRELLTKLDLMREGSEIKHCVGGYTSVVKSNTSRILSIRPKAGRDKTKWSTVELRDKRYTYGNYPSGRTVEPQSLAERRAKLQIVGKVGGRDEPTTRG